MRGEQHDKCAAEIVKQFPAANPAGLQDIPAIAAIIARHKSQELAQWKRFASYCRSCAMSGEFPLMFEEFQHRELRPQANEEKP